MRRIISRMFILVLLSTIVGRYLLSTWNHSPVGVKKTYKTLTKDDTN
jgi:hypothetical protein